MTQTPSTMIPIGTPIPTFSLPDGEGHMWTIPSEHAGILVIFMCNHCPFVVHVAHVLPKIHAACKAAGITMIGINSNNIDNYPADSPEHMVSTASEYGWEFPYLFDKSQEVATSFQAACTPDIFMYTSKGELYYRGQLDDSRPNDGSQADGSDLLEAIEAMIAGAPSPEVQKPAIGCNIKWKC